MSVEQVVDAYLQAAHQILGTTTAPDATAPTDPNTALPHPDWTGNANATAAKASAALHQARTHLYTAAKNVADITASANQISRDAQQQLHGITADWDHAKAAAASTPPPLRDAVLLTSGQLHIAEAMTLISVTAAQYDQAADAVRAHTPNLPAPPHHLDDPHSGSDPTAAPATTPPAPPPPPDQSPTPSTTVPAATIPPAGGLDPALAPAAAGLMPAAMAPLAAPASMMPMAAALPTAAAAPMSSLSSLASQPCPNRAQPPTTEQPLSDQSKSTGDIRATRVPRNGSVDAAIDTALDALGITDPDARTRWHAGYQTLIQRESGGNPNAVNLTDPNARGPIQPDGAPAGASRGYTQVTPDTFRRFRLPTLSNDIYDGASNIAASMRYVMDVHEVQPSAIDLVTKVQQANPHAPAAAY